MFHGCARHSLTCSADSALHWGGRIFFSCDAAKLNTLLMLCFYCRLEISEELRNLILRMLDKNPDTRITIPELKVTKQKKRRLIMNHLLQKPENIA